MASFGSIPVFRKIRSGMRGTQFGNTLVSVKNLISHHFQWYKTGLYLELRPVIQSFKPKADTPRWFSDQYVFNTLNQSAWVGKSAKVAHREARMDQRIRLIFVSHEAARTGAPAIILRLMEMFSQCDQFECYCILDEGGERLEEFQALAHTHVMSHHRYDKTFTPNQALTEVRRLMCSGIGGGRPPALALVNSAESFRLTRHLYKSGVPVFTLIHEFADHYPDKRFKLIANFSRKIIFPSQIISRTAQQHSGLNPGDSVVLGQGLLEDDFGKLDRDNCRASLRESLGLEADAFIVLNVGTMDIRKGLDLFVDAARLYLQTHPHDTKTHFVWYGRPHNETDEVILYARNIVRSQDLNSRIHLEPSTSQIEQVFIGADLFLSTARADPFPCVIHEAMVCGLPIIVFRDGGGAQELMDETCGTCVDMADLPQLVTAIADYRNNPDKWAEHSKNSILKIKTDWSYQSYFHSMVQILTEIQAMPKDPADYDLRQAPDHLAIISGSLADYEVLNQLMQKSDRQISEVALVRGRFEPEADETVKKLSQAGIKYTVHQPVKDAPEDIQTIVEKLLFKPRPHKATVIDLTRCLDPDKLKLLQYPIRLVQVHEEGDTSGILRIFQELDEVISVDPALCDALQQAGSNKTTRVTHLKTRFELQAVE